MKAPAVLLLVSLAVLLLAPCLFAPQLLALCRAHLISGKRSSPSKPKPPLTAPVLAGTSSLAPEAPSARPSSAPISIVAEPELVLTSVGDDCDAFVAAALACPEGWVPVSSPSLVSCEDGVCSKERCCEPQAEMEAIEVAAPGEQEASEVAEGPVVAAQDAAVTGHRSVVTGSPLVAGSKEADFKATSPAKLRAHAPRQLMEGAANDTNTTTVTTSTFTSSTYTATSSTNTDTATTNTMTPTTTTATAEWSATSTTVAESLSVESNVTGENTTATTTITATTATTTMTEAAEPLSSTLTMTATTSTGAVPTTTLEPNETTSATVFSSTVTTSTTTPGVATTSGTASENGNTTFIDFIEDSNVTSTNVTSPATTTTTTTTTMTTVTTTTSVTTSLSPAPSTTTVAPVVVAGRLELSVAGGSIEQMLGELRAETEQAVANGLAELLGVPQDWIEVTLTVADAAERRLRGADSVVVAAASAAAHRRLAQLLVAIYKITVPSNAQGASSVESISSIQDVFAASDSQQLTDVLQDSFSQALGNQFQIQVEAFSVPSTSVEDALVPVASPPSVTPGSEPSLAAPRLTLTWAHAVTLVALIAVALAQ